MRPRQRKPRLFRPQLEALEQRRLMAGDVPALLVPNVVDAETLPVETVAIQPAATALQPAVLFTDADFDRMRAGVTAGADPWITQWNRLRGDGFSDPNWNPRTLETVVRGGTGENFAQLVIDIQRAYQTALVWKISGDTRYAEASIRIMNAWSTVNTVLTGNADRFLASGLYAFDWAAAADIMKDYSGWAAADQTQFHNYLLNVYWPLQESFLFGFNGGKDHNGAAITNYWANWDLANIEGMMAIGIVTGRQDIYDKAFDYLFTGRGNGALDKLAYYLHPGNLMQWQESGRDQGHTILGMALFGHVAQMAWNQGYDLYSYNNNQFLAAAEYIAKYNLGYDVPYQSYSWGTGVNGAWSSQTAIGSGSRGNGGTAYALIYSHYVQLLGMAAPYTTERIQRLGPEGRNNGDDMGWGTLTYSRTPVATAALVPTGLTALERGAGAIQLDWFGTVNSTGYDVYRADSAAGPFVKIASNVSDLLTYTDWGRPAGTFFYKVQGITATGTTGFSDVVSATSTNQLIAQLAFNEGTGTTAADSTGNGVTGTLLGGATWAGGKTGTAVNLDGSTGYVSLPAGVVGDVADFTISTWVNLDTVGTWSRIFDFGDSRGNWMFLTPKNGSGVLEFATSTTYGYNKQSLTGPSPLPTGQWVHVAVTLANKIGTLYVNGVAVGSYSNMEFPPFQIGDTPRNWIGRSQFSSDPYLDGRVDDFRISRGALTAGEVFALATGTTPPALPGAPAGVTATAVVGNTVNLAWSSTAGASSYTIKRATSPTGQFVTVATLVKTTTYADTNLAAGTTYYYVIDAANNGGDGPGSAVASATALPPLPGVVGSLTASSNSPTAVTLTWAAASNAVTYSISRSLTSGGPYTTIASAASGTTFSDPALSSGTTYFYVVRGVNAAGTGGVSSEVSAMPSDLRVRLRLDDTAGTAAADAANSGFAGTLVGGAAWGTGRFGGALDLDGTSGHATLGTGVVNGLTAFTATAWVNLDTSSTWARVFDFGSSTSSYMFLTTKNGANSTPRFAIRTSSVTEQTISGTSALATGSWVHLAVTLSGSIGILYVNGIEAGRNSSMTLTPASLGVSTLNYLGRSQWSADPFLDGRIDDFRMYNRALTSSEVRNLALPALTQVTVSPAAIPNGTPAGGVVGTMSTLLADPYRTFSYQLVAGTGGDDNAAFTLTNGRLTVNDAVDYEAKTAYTIRVRGTDEYGTTTERALALTVTPPPQQVVTVGSGSETVASPPSGDLLLRKQGLGTLVLDTAGSYAGGTVIEQGTLVIRDPAALGSGSVRVKAGARLVLDVGAGDVPLPSFVVDQGGLMDLGYGRITLAAGDLTSEDVRQLLLAGRGDGSWSSGTGLTTRFASPDYGFGLGYLQNEEGTIVIGFVAAGDVNMDGMFDVLDVATLVANGGLDAPAPAGWAGGDFNYDGVYDALDIGDMLAANVYDQGFYIPVPQAPAAGAPATTVTIDGTLSPAAAAFASLMTSPSTSVKKRTFAAV